MDYEEITIEGMTYALRPAPFREAKRNATKLLSLAKGAISARDEHVHLDIGELLANIGSPEMESVENFILMYAEARIQNAEGVEKTVLLKDMNTVNAHFKKHTSHYYPLMFAGVKYHFLPFVPGGLESLSAMSFSDLMGKALE